MSQDKRGVNLFNKLLGVPEPVSPPAPAPAAPQEPPKFGPSNGKTIGIQVDGKLFRLTYWKAMDQPNDIGEDFMRYGFYVSHKLLFSTPMWGIYGKLSESAGNLEREIMIALLSSAGIPKLYGSITTYAKANGVDPGNDKVRKDWGQYIAAYDFCQACNFGVFEMQKMIDDLIDAKFLKIKEKTGQWES